MDVLKKINNIETKIQLLVDKLRSLKQENKVLVDENIELKANVSQQKELINDLKTKLIKTQRALELRKEDEPKESQKLRKQMDRYIAEIDRIVDWLNNA